MSVIEVSQGNSDRDIEPFNENPEPSVTSWDDPTIRKSRTVEEYMPPTCGDFSCEGDCDLCKDIGSYNERLQEALQLCKRQRFYDDPLAATSDIENIVCSCQICTMELFHPQNDEEKEELS